MSTSGSSPASQPGKSSARDQLRQQRAAEAKAAKKKKVLILVLATLALVAALVAGFAVAGEAKRDKDANVTVEGQSLTQALTSIPAASFDAVGVGTATNVPEAIPGGKPQLVDGKPRVLYIGAEFCPYCAMERMALVSSLSRFGTFSGLKDTLSSPNEGPISNIPTVTFTGSTFTSDTVALTAVETQDRMGQPTGEKPTAEDEAIFRKHAPQGGIPFTWYGSAFSNWAGFDGDSMAGKQPEEIAKALGDPNSDESKAVLGASNVISAQLCKETGGKPAEVCTSAGVTEAAKKLK
ncbi:MULTISPECIES: DUF929 family protein [unclassified Luteococcus]|uniref:DUF929 family protein n=1 Tax=unclassified Luteococcus TaxID=2639923 RepID=UPI00313F36AB